IQVVSRARQSGIRFSAKDLFQHQTIKSLANVAQVADTTQQIDQGPVLGTTPLLPIQQLFLLSDTPEPHHFNQSVMLEPSRPLDAAVLDHALHALLEHHDALRLVFSLDGEHPGARYLPLDPTCKLLWQAEVADEPELNECANRAQASLNIQQGPLL